MKTKNYYLIIAALFLLLLPFQSGCDKTGDGPQPLQTEGQAVGNGQGVALAPPPLPETGPDGKPIGPATIIYGDNNRLKAGAAIEKIFVSEGIHGENGKLNCWDVELYHFIQTNFIPGEVTYIHYINIPGKGWVSHVDVKDPAGGSNYTWDVSFREGDVVSTYGYTYHDGSWTGKWGPTITVEAPEASGDDGWKELCFDAVKLVVKSCIQGLKGTWRGWATFLAWDITGSGMYNDCVNFYVCDQDGNPLHAETGPVDNFLGVSMVDDADRSLGTKRVTCKEPNGPGSWDDNLYNKYVNIDLSEYDNNDLWGTTEDNIPTVIVVFNTNGTHQVLKPGTPFKDSRDGQVYNIVKIGGQTWMAENLNYDCSGSYVYNNDAANGDIYGRLYKWGTATLAAPDGWHLPSDTEWTTLIDYLGGKSNAPDKMKEPGTEHWNSTWSGITNESGFTALGGGENDIHGYRYLCHTTWFWSATEKDNSSAWVRYMSYSRNTVVSRNGWPKSSGLSVRCVKD